MILSWTYFYGNSISNYELQTNRESDMAGIVVTTLEELKSVQKVRSHPTIVIEGELANNLLISGIVRFKDDRQNGEGEVLQLKETNSQLFPFFEVLFDLSRAHCFQILSNNSPKQIKIYPKPSCRREGN